MMQNAHNKPKVGRTSLKRMNRTIGGQTEHIEVMGRLKDFERCARKNRVSYIVERNSGTDPPTWKISFKAPQGEDITNAFKEYSEKVLNPNKGKPSILNALRRFKNVAISQPQRVKNKEHEEHTL